jgi:L-ascorbate oxidase
MMTPQLEQHFDKKIYMFWLFIKLVFSVTIKETLVISKGYSAPECFNTTTYLINGNFVGPTIHATEGDTLELTIVNENDSPLSIHFHGLKQRESPEADGAAFISNSPIQPFETHTVVVKIASKDEAGTHFYHGHIGLTDLHVYGALIVHPVNNTLIYDEERVLILSEFWRESLDSLHDGLVHAPIFKWIGPPNSFLTNGNSLGTNCTARSEYSVIPVESNKSYRFRIIGAGSLYYMNFYIPGHKMLLVEVEGTLIVPIEIDHLEIFSGQRYSVIVTANQPAADYYMEIQGRWRNDAPKNGFSILRYNGTIEKIITLESEKAILDPEQIGWITGNFAPLEPHNIPKPNKTWVLEGKQVLGDLPTQFRWAINNVSYILPSEPIFQYAVTNTLSELPENSKSYLAELNDVIDIVLQNTVAINGVCEAHPWHMHGHNFWVISNGPGQYDPSIPDNESPIKRDTVTVYPWAHAYNQEVGIAGEPCGWTKIRYVADNPGAWAFHCHISAHMAMGMAITIVEGGERILSKCDSK